MIAPAWNCRSWTVKKIEQRPYPELSYLQCLERLSIPLRENIAYRGFMALPKRLWVEFRLWMAPDKMLPLRYRVLSPRWDLIEKYGHVSDDDAVADIDSHAGISFFRSRGYQILSHPTPLSRLLSRGEPLLVRKSIS